MGFACIAKSTTYTIMYLKLQLTIIIKITGPVKAAQIAPPSSEIQHLKDGVVNKQNKNHIKVHT